MTLLTLNFCLILLLPESFFSFFVCVCVCVCVCVHVHSCVRACVGQEGTGAAQGSRGGSSQDGEAPQPAEGTRAKHSLGRPLWLLSPTQQHGTVLDSHSGKEKKEKTFLLTACTSKQHRHNKKNICTCLLKMLSSDLS